MYSYRTWLQGLTHFKLNLAKPPRVCDARFSTTLLNFLQDAQAVLTNLVWFVLWTFTCSPEVLIKQVLSRKKLLNKFFLNFSSIDKKCLNYSSFAVFHHRRKPCVQYSCKQAEILPSSEAGNNLLEWVLRVWIVVFVSFMLELEHCKPKT